MALIVSHFFFDTIGAKKTDFAGAKSLKRNAKRISRSAEREEGYAPSTAPPFEKGGRKLFKILPSIAIT